MGAFKDFWAASSVEGDLEDFDGFQIVDWDEGGAPDDEAEEQEFQDAVKATRRHNNSTRLLDSFGLYNKEIDSKVDSECGYIDQEEEIRLGRLIRQAVVKDEKGKEYFDHENATEEQKGARQRLIESHLRLVIVIAKIFYGNHMQLNDFIDEGNIGLIKAAEKFDPEYGVRFATFANLYIRGEILHALKEQEPDIYLPNNNITRNLSPFKKAVIKATAELMCEPTKAQLAQHLGEDRDFVEKLLTMPRVSVSGDQLLKDDDSESATIFDMTPDTVFGDPVDYLANCEEDASLEDLFYEALDSDMLSERDRDIIMSRHLIDDKREKRTLQDLSDQYGVSTQRINQLEKKSIQKLEDYVQSRLPADYKNKQQMRELSAA